MHPALLFDEFSYELKKTKASSKIVFYMLATILQSFVIQYYKTVFQLHWGCLTISVFTVQFITPCSVGHYTFDWNKFLSEISNIFHTCLQTTHNKHSTICLFWLENESWKVIVVCNIGKSNRLIYFTFFLIFSVCSQMGSASPLQLQQLLLLCEDLPQDVGVCLMECLTTF